MIAKIKTIFMLFLTGIALTSGVTSHVVASSGSQDEEARKRLRAKLIKYEAAYEKYEAELTDKQKNICQAKLDVTSARLDGRDEKQVLGLCKRLQALIIDEAERTQNKPPRVWRGNNTLRRVFNVEKPLLGTCFAIAKLCRYSEKMTMQEKIREIKAQADISNDSRIRRMVIDLLTENERYEDAMDYCKEQISNIEQGKKKGQISHYQYELIKTLLLYQNSLYSQAMQEQGIDWDQVINIGPHLVKIDLAQWRIARKEAEEYIKENPRLAQRCLSLFTSNNPYLGSIANLKEIKEFYQSTSLKLKQASSQAEPIPVGDSPSANDKPAAIKEGLDKQAKIEQADSPTEKVSVKQLRPLWAWPSFLIGALAGMGVVYLVLLLKKMARGRGKSRAT